MIDYQRQNGNKYFLPEAVYQQTLWQIRGYFKLIEQVGEIKDDLPIPASVLLHSSNIEKQDLGKARRLERKMAVIKVIENAINSIPKEYRDGVWNSVHFRTPYPKVASSNAYGACKSKRNVYGIFKAKFVYDVAKGLCWL